MTRLIAAAAAALVLASPAFAQGNKPNTTQAQAKFSEVAKGDLFSSKLKGLNITNQNNESIGEISDLAIKGQTVNALILSVGGFLGLGERYVAVPPSAVNIRYDDKDSKWRATMNTTKDALKAAPEFKYPSK